MVQLDQARDRVFTGITVEALLALSLRRMLTPEQDGRDSGQTGSAGTTAPIRPVADAAMAAAK